MKQLDFSSKRAQLALRFFTYGVMTLATVILTLLFIFVAMGYRFDRNKLSFIQGGLIQFQSSPSSAAIYIDGKNSGLQTSDKINLNAGIHTISMSLQGYQPWKKTINLSAGELLWLNYARLIPNAIPTSTVKTFSTMSQVVGSPDHHWFLVQADASKPEFDLVDYSNSKKPATTQLAVPLSVFTPSNGKVGGTFSIIEWDLGSQYVLLRHDDGSVHEFIRMDRSHPDQAINVTQVFGLNITDAHFSGSNPNVIYAKTDTILRSLDVGNSSASAALVNNITTFTVYGQDAIIYTAPLPTNPDQQIVGLYNHGKTTTIRTYPVTDHLIYKYLEYQNDTYLAIGTTASSTVDILRNPTDATKDTTSLFAQLHLPVALQYLTVSDNGRMIVAQSGNDIATYDLETLHTYNAKVDVGAPIDKPLQWLDDFYLWTDVGGHFTIFEFDGTNIHRITNVASGYGVVISNDGRGLLTIGREGSDYTLQNSLLILN